jgi:hypothetical protein
MRRAIAALTLLAGLGITDARAECVAKANVVWQSAKAFDLSLEAHAVGTNCATSAVILLVTDAKGAVQWSTTRLAQENALFREGITDDTSMQKALKNWLAEGNGVGPKSTKEMPEWKPNKEQAEREGDGEFGFYAGEDVTQDFYQSAREENQPLFCFVQGVESTSCIGAAGPTAIYEIGGFTFPG